ncbi:MAG: GNAT family N-acetyltransferase [Woeseiaceae bacterium]|nr:GNAT family N-acetyltransferase [Woeseiaceae bacterium]
MRHYMLALLNDPAFHQYIGDRGVQSEAQASDYIKDGAIASYTQFGYGMYLAELKSDARAAGICGLVRRDGLDDPDLGFAFMPEFRSQGLASEAASAVLRYAVDELALPRVVAIVTPDNQASIALLKEAGMRQDGTVRLPGGDTDLDLYVYEV